MNRRELPLLFILMVAQWWRICRQAGDTRDSGLIPELGRSPGEGNGNPLQYSCLGNPMDGGTWRATGHGVAKNWMQLSTYTPSQCMNSKHFVKNLMLSPWQLFCYKDTLQTFLIYFIDVFWTKTKQGINSISWAVYQS